MGKHEVGTPKYIANKIKAKGLQKLRWYCQMCQKQCRDENGFKCHTMSESHQRQLLLFADNAGKYMDEFSREFSQGYVNLLKRQFGTKRVPANRVYQDYIADRDHIHMNATKWLSLTGFVKWLGRSGQCVVDETEKGWFVTYIDRDPETLAAQEKKAKKEKMDKDDQERMMDFIEKQVERGRQETDEDSCEFKKPLERPEQDKPLVLELKLKPKPVPVVGPSVSFTFDSKLKKKRGNSGADEQLSEYEYESNKKIKREQRDEKNEKKKNATDIKSEKEEGWLRAGLVVKVVTRSLGEKYHRAKGVVQLPEDKSPCCIARVKLTSPTEVKDHVLRLDQEHLETVIPAIGKPVTILRGKFQGTMAALRKLRLEEFSVDVELLERDKGLLVKRLPYEDVCKFSNS
ncbi:DNA/RNA-binding protein KIN17 [Neodiprion lecontei]|uniref:DNA/RNA-binding protein KIN17 n=1 Tax=Neodiprion lecontei TaxID=441921 RepID=A0A6J0C5T7_NEOLC|nr:DNA/RNA-binding protein KIN17 [Neodiprion lecontei]